MGQALIAFKKIDDFLIIKKYVTIYLEKYFIFEKILKIGFC
jgi:hypothetical protein